MTLNEYLKGKSRADFARDIGVDASTITLWCNGKRKPSLHNIKKVQEATKDSVRAEDWLKDV